MLGIEPVGIKRLNMHSVSDYLDLYCFCVANAQQSELRQFPQCGRGRSLHSPTALFCTNGKLHHGTNVQVVSHR